jgi:hypothetical protein
MSVDRATHYNLYYLPVSWIGFPLLRFCCGNRSRTPMARIRICRSCLLSVAVCGKTLAQPRTYVAD